METDELKGNKPIVAFTLDFETGGLNCVNCACTQIALHAVRIDTFETVDRYVKYILPYKKQEKGVKAKKVLKTKYEQEDAPMMQYEEKALTYSDISMDTLESKGEEISQVAKEVIDFIKRNTASKARNEKPFLIGQNIGFDIGFMQQLMAYGKMEKEWEQCMRGQKDFYGNFQPLYVDTIVMGQLAFSQIPEMNSYKLDIMSEKLGIELDDAHDADADVTATTNVLMSLTKRMRSEGSGEGSDMELTKKEKTRAHFKI